jgi:deazaflavin-dependent oxidoreductase (nitroreductase family)
MGRPGSWQDQCANNSAPDDCAPRRTWQVRTRLRSPTVTEAEDWNSKIIAEFRANGGKVGGNFEGAPLLLLHTVGARSGQPRINPMMYQDIGDGLAVFASKAGAPTNPDWYHNLRANPQVSAEIGAGTAEFTARVAEGAERERIWAAQKSAYPGFADYETKTTRQIPVVILEPVQ